MTRRAAHVWLADHPWRYHYEVVVRRHGVEQIVARTRSRREAELVIARVYRAVEISQHTVAWRRVRGVHPVNVAKGCVVLALLTLLLPWLWVQLVGSLVYLALISGLLTSGTSWKRGGADDR